MKYRFIITINDANGKSYTCERLANTEEQALSMVRIPNDETIICIVKDLINTVF